MKSTLTLCILKFAGCLTLAIGLSASSFASCGDSLSALAAAAVLAHNQSPTVQAGSTAAQPISAKTSIVGMWHIQFVVGDHTIQEAYQIWNVGGTEVHNPNVDPRTGSVCLGVWRHAAHGTYKLAHRVWSYDTEGNFTGTIHLSETLNLGDGGKTHNGSFALDFYDPTGAFQFEVAGDVKGERIKVD
jgi:hypothetical protein